MKDWLLTPVRIARSCRDVLRQSSRLNPPRRLDYWLAIRGNLPTRKRPVNQRAQSALFGSRYVLPAGSFSDWDSPEDNEAYG